MKNQWKLVLSLILVLLVAILAVLNVDPVPVNLGFHVVELPLIILILGTLLVGVIITAVFSTFKLYQERREIQKLDNELSEIESKHQKELTESISAKDQEIDELNHKIASYEREVYNLKQTIPAYVSKHRSSEIEEMAEDN